METSKRVSSGLRGKKILPILGIVIVFTGFMMFRLIHNTPMIAADTDSIKIGTINRESFTGTVSVTGILDANGKSVISSQLSGVVAEVMVKEGSKVKKGSILASLDKRDFQVQLNQAQINVHKAQNTADQAKITYDQAQTDFGRSEQLFEAGVLAQSDLEQIRQKRDVYQSQYEAAVHVGLPAAQESLKQAQLALDKTDLVSPIDGTVVTCTINPGDFINANTTGPVITIVRDDQINFTGNVPENVLIDLALGQRAEVEADNLPGASVYGQIISISQVSIPTGQFFPVKISIQDSGNLKPGMTATANIHVDVNHALSVPKRAVFRRDGQNCVYVVNEHQAVKTVVSIGIQGENTVSVLEGISAGDRIVTEGTDAVLDGMTLPESIR
jgi:RND family efflux transporter MFP subunit